MIGDHSSLLILKVDFIYVKNRILKLNVGCVKTKWPANRVFSLTRGSMSMLKKEFAYE